jgi:branched-chain amino acid transport system substrate-binding protein
VVRIGALFPFTGNLAILGNEAFGGTDVAAEMVNERGGIWDGCMIEWVRADVTDPTVAASEAERLITQEDVKVLHGTYGSSNALAMSAVAERYGVVYWEGGAGDLKITSRGFQCTFRSTENTETLGSEMVDGVTDVVLPELGQTPAETTVALVYEDSAFGTAIGDACRWQANLQGYQIVADEPYSAQVVDLSDLILRMKALDPDVLLVSQYFNDAILFMKQARELDYVPRAIMAIGTAQASPDFAAALGSDADGILYVDAPTGVDVSGLDPEAQAILEEFTTRYEEMMDKPAAAHVFRDFHSVWILLNWVLPEARSLECEDIRAAALSLDIPYGKTITGWGVRYGDDGQNERLFAAVAQWQNGERVVVGPEHLATGEAILVPLPSWSER